VSEPTNQGFGTTFIRRSAKYELGGTAKFAFDTDGLQMQLAFPLEA
jgi:two-component sensor histidine kinase